METTVSSKGQIVVPAELRQRDKITAGQRFDIERLDGGEYLLRRKSPPPNSGLLDLLLSCPSKGWFEPLERTETTDALRPPRGR